MTQTNTAPNTNLQVFNKIWWGQLISIIGSGLTSFSLSIWVYMQTGSVTLFAVMLVFARLPTILVSPIAGVIADRFDRRLVMIFSDSCSALVTLIVATLMATGKIEIWHVFAARLFYSIFESFQVPAYAAATTLLVPKEDYAKISGMVQLAVALGEIAAPIIAGGLMMWIQIPGLLIFDFVTYLFALLTLVAVRFPALPGKSEKLDKETVWQEISIGWTYVISRSGILVLLFYFMVINFVVGFISSLIAPLVLSFSTPSMFGIVGSVSGLGLLIGSIGMSVSGGPRQRIKGIVVSFLVMGVFLVLVGVLPNIPLISFAVFGILLIVPVIQGCGQAILQSKVPADIQGRVFAMLQALVTVATLFAIAISGPLADQVFNPLLMETGSLANSVGKWIGIGEGRGIGLIFILLGFFAMLAALIGYLSPRLRNVENEIPDIHLTIPAGESAD